MAPYTLSSRGAPRLAPAGAEAGPLPPAPAPARRRSRTRVRPCISGPPRPEPGAGSAPTASSQSEAAAWDAGRGLQYYLFQGVVPQAPRPAPRPPGGGRQASRTAPPARWRAQARRTSSLASASSWAARRWRAAARGAELAEAVRVSRTRGSLSTRSPPLASAARCFSAPEQVPGGDLKPQPRPLLRRTAALTGSASTKASLTRARTQLRRETPRAWVLRLRFLVAPRKPPPVSARAAAERTGARVARWALARAPYNCFSITARAP